MSLEVYPDNVCELLGFSRAGLTWSAVRLLPKAREEPSQIHEHCNNPEYQYNDTSVFNRNDSRRELVLHRNYGVFYEDYFNAFCSEIPPTNIFWVFLNPYQKAEIRIQKVSW